jgi:hypothetical protein
MTPNWQLAIALAAVAWAALVVIRRIWDATSGRRAGCGTTACGGCKQLGGSALIMLETDGRQAS